MAIAPLLQGFMQGFSAMRQQNIENAQRQQQLELEKQRTDANTRYLEALSTAAQTKSEGVAERAEEQSLSRRLSAMNLIQGRLQSLEANRQKAFNENRDTSFYDQRIAQLGMLEDGLFGRTLGGLLIQPGAGMQAPTEQVEEPNATETPGPKLESLDPEQAMLSKAPAQVPPRKLTGPQAANLTKDIEAQTELAGTKRIQDFMGESLLRANLPVVLERNYVSVSTKEGDEPKLEQRGYRFNWFKSQDKKSAPITEEDIAANPDVITDALAAIEDTEQRSGNIELQELRSTYQHDILSKAESALLAQGGAIEQSDPFSLISSPRNQVRTQLQTKIAEAKARLGLEPEPLPEVKVEHPVRATSKFLRAAREALTSYPEGYGLNPIVAIEKATAGEKTPRQEVLSAMSTEMLSSLQSIPYEELTGTPEGAISLGYLKKFVDDNLTPSMVERATLTTPLNPKDGKAQEFVAFVNKAYQDAETKGDTGYEPASAERGMKNIKATMKEMFGKDPILQGAKKLGERGVDEALSRYQEELIERGREGYEKGAPPRPKKSLEELRAAHPEMQRQLELQRRLREEPREPNKVQKLIESLKVKPNKAREDLPAREGPHFGTGVGKAEGGGAPSGPARMLAMLSMAGVQAEPKRETDQVKVGTTLLSQYARGQGLRERVGTKDKVDYLPLQSFISKASESDLKALRSQWKEIQKQHAVPDDMVKQVDQLLAGQEARRGVPGQERKRVYTPTATEKARNEAYQGARQSLSAGKLEEFADKLEKVDVRELKLLLDDASESKVALKLVKQELALRAKRRPKNG